MTVLNNAAYQHPQDLTLAVLTDDVLPNLSYLRQHTIRFRNWAVRFAIIGESHHVRIMRREACVLDEVLACVDVRPDNCIFHRQFARMESLAFDTERYRVAVSFDGEPLWEPTERGAKGIDYVFPPIFGQYPVTRIQWWRHGTVLHWRTLHSYATHNQTTYVHTESQFDCN